MKWGGVPGGLAKSILDFVYPPTCVSCRTLLQENDRHLCSKCWASIPRLTAGHPLFCETLDRLVESNVLSGLVSSFLFEKEGAFQALVHALKYDGYVSVGLLLGRELGKAVMNSSIKPDCLIPVPLHLMKLRERGFNQAEAIARGISEVTGTPVRTDILRRSRNTQTQTKLDKEQRKQNMHDAFVIVAGSTLHGGRTCLLVDDVITTGATIVAGGVALQEAGFEKIYAASSALAE